MTFNITWNNRAPCQQILFKIPLKESDYNKVSKNPGKYDCKNIEGILYFRGIKIVEVKPKKK
jgi:hypothetical protein